MTFHIHIQGLVQGVGFRPFVYQYATSQNLNGFVCNSNDGVHIEINTTKEIADIFLQNLLNNAPKSCIVTNYSIKNINEKNFKNFSIIKSDFAINPNLLITPDYGICNNCTAELEDKNNVRYQYPFITCTQCGPRFSIINSLPYDRHLTTMEPFTMCTNCIKEYNLPSDRRFYSQTNSCKNCGIQLSVFQNKINICKGNKESLKFINDSLNQGKIIAIKGIGGYLLLCDATNENAIKELRKRKKRPSKPFAIMVENIETLHEIVNLNYINKKEITSAIAPIILLNTKEKNDLPLHLIAPNLNAVGVMMPYTPLFHLILQTFKKSIIATSANFSNAPIIYKDANALQQLPEIADYIITNNREILIPQDDSVIQFTKQNNRKIILRRGRGLAPNFFDYHLNTNKTILATGALMKSSFTITHHKNTYVSQYLGSTISYDAQIAYQNSLTHFLQVLNATPQIIIADKHKDYFTNTLAYEYANKMQTTVIEVQHHKAHFAAVLAENNLVNSKEPILGVIWDGTGFGDDGQIWGGEFFKYENNTFLRCYYFDYFVSLLNDKMAKEPRLSLLSICAEVLGADEIVKEKFTAVEYNLYQRLLLQKDNLLTSSVGRIFDAVASLLNLCQKQSYEGEAALLLETLAITYTNVNGYGFNESYFMDGAHYNRLPTATIFTGIIRDIQKGKSNEFIAAKFHYSLVHVIDIIAKNIGVNKIAFSGGVFQNALLVDMLEFHLNNKYEIFFHKQLSPNDENISFGQMVYWDNNMDKVQLMNKEKMVQVSDTTMHNSSTIVC